MRSPWSGLSPLLHAWSTAIQLTDCYRFFKIPGFTALKGKEHHGSRLTRKTAQKEHFEQMFEKADRYLCVHAPGRLRLLGTTDHEGGRAAAGALDVAIDAICAHLITWALFVLAVLIRSFEVDFLQIWNPSEDEFLYH